MNTNNSSDVDEDRYLDALVAAAPPLTEQQRTALAELLRPVRIGGAR